MTDTKPKKLTLMHPTCGTTLTEQPYCQYCAEPFKDVLLHKDKCLSECNHAYCSKCFEELLLLDKNCTICNEPLKYKMLPCQQNSSRFRTKSKVRSSYSLQVDSSQGKLKMFKVNTVSPSDIPPFPLLGDCRGEGSNGKGNVVGNYKDFPSIINPNMTKTKMFNNTVSPVTTDNLHKFTEMDLPCNFASGIPLF